MCHCKMTLFIYSKTPVDATFAKSHWYTIKGPIYWATKAEVGFLDCATAKVTCLGIVKPPLRSHEFKIGGTGILVKRRLGVTTDGTDLLFARVVYNAKLWGVSRKSLKRRDHTNVC